MTFHSDEISGTQAKRLPIDYREMTTGSSQVVSRVGEEEPAGGANLPPESARTWNACVLWRRCFSSR